MFATANQSLETRTLARDLKMGPRRTQSGRIRKRRRFDGGLFGNPVFVEILFTFSGLQIKAVKSLYVKLI